MAKATWSRERTGEPAWEGFDELPYEEDDRAWYVCQVHKGSGLNLEQVGELVGLTRERVRQVQLQAMRKLRRRLELHPDGVAILQQLMLLSQERTKRGERVWPEMTTDCDHRERWKA